MTGTSYNNSKSCRYIHILKKNILLLLLSVIIPVFLAIPVQASPTILENSNEIMADPELNNTPTGTNVVVEFEEMGLNVTFANVIKSGQTSISPSTTCPFPPDGYKLVGDYYNISTTAEHAGNITICINYDDPQIITESLLKVFHYEVEENELFAYEQSGINTGDTFWNLTGASYPGLLCSGNERLNFVINGPGLEINGTGDNFVYDTSIYTSNGETIVGWLGEPFSVIEHGSNWYISRFLINEDEYDSHIIYEGDSINLGECFMLKVVKFGVDDTVQLSITRCGEEVCNLTVEEDALFEYNEDLNNSGCKDNWVLRFNVETVFVGMEVSIVKINTIQFRSPDVVTIETPETSVIPGFTITSEHNDSMLKVRLNSADDNITLEKGGTVNLLSDRLRFKLDEKGDIGGILDPSSITRTWIDVTSSLRTDDNIICGIVTDLSEFIIAEEIDIIPPVINYVFINNTIPYTGDAVQVIVHATDNNGVVSVSANGVPLTYQVSDIWTGTIIAQLGSYGVHIRAHDATGLTGGSYFPYSKRVRIANNTPVGTDVQVRIPEISATLTFANITQSGQTYVSNITADFSPPTGYNTLCDYYNIMTTAKYNGNISVCFSYGDPGGFDENNVRILHYEEVEDQTEVFAITQENISIGDTIWNLTAADYPDALCEGSLESLYFVIDGPRLEINGSDNNFNYSTSVYYQHGDPYIAWLDELHYVVDSCTYWYLSKVLVDETQDDSYTLIVGEIMNLIDGVTITPVEVDIYGKEVWIRIIKNGEEVDSSLGKEGQQYIYKKDLNEDGKKDWVLKFNVDTVIIGPEYDLVNISGLKLISSEIIKIEAPDTDLLSGFNVTCYNNTLRTTLDYPDDKIELIRGGVVNLIGDKFRFKLDEEGDVGGILKRPTKIWNDVTYSADNNTNTICGIVSDLSEFVIAEPINDSWRDMWMGEESQEGTAVSTTELQDAIHHWLDDIPVNGHILSTANLQEVISIWLSDNSPPEINTPPDMKIDFDS